MSTKRFFTVIVAAALIAVVAFIAQGAFATASPGYTESAQQVARERSLGERYGVLPGSQGEVSAAQNQREYFLGERYGVLPGPATFSAAQIQREYFLGERYGVLPGPATFSAAQIEREYWLGERYGVLP